MERPCVTSLTFCDFPIEVALVVPLGDDDRVRGVGSTLGDAVERRARFEFHRRTVDRAQLRVRLQLDLMLEFLFEPIMCRSDPRAAQTFLTFQMCSPGKSRAHSSVV